MENIVNKIYKLKETSPDLMIKKVKVGAFSFLYVVSFETISSSDKINDFILKYIASKSFKSFKNIGSDIKEYIPSINYKDINDEDVFNYLFNGFTILIYKREIIAFETRAEIDRGISESTSEPTVRGPKDSFCENYQKNIGLIRKRIKSEYLCVEEMEIGTLTKSKTGILYLSNVCDNSIVNEVKNKLSSINIDGILDSNYLKEFIDSKNKTLLPTILYTEKPDDVSRYLLEGRVIVTVDASPSVLVVPCFFVDFLSSSEDYYHKPFFASFMRIIRLIAFFISIILPGLFIAIINYDPEVLPFTLLINFSMQRSSVPFPAVIEAFLLMGTFELLYEGDSRMPTTRGTSLSVLGALVLGDSAVKAGLISPIMVIIVSISAISSLVFIYHDIQGSIRFYRYLLMIISAMFGVIGFIIGMQVFLLDICSTSLFGRPYTLPSAPLMIKDAGNSYIKRAITKLKRRPSYLSKKNSIRER